MSTLNAHHTLCHIQLFAFKNEELMTDTLYNPGENRKLKFSFYYS